MNSPSYSLNIDRGVRGFGTSQLAPISLALYQHPRFHDLAGSDFFTSHQNMRANVVSSNELLRLYTALGHQASIDEIYQLKDEVENALPASIDKPVEDVSCVPVYICKGFVDNLTGDRTKELVFAVSPAVATERLLALKAIRRFYGIEQGPSRVWIPQTCAAGISLARGRKSTARGAINFLYQAINNGEVEMPKNINLTPGRRQIVTN